MNTIISKYKAYLFKQPIPHEYAERCAETAAKLLAKLPPDQILTQRTEQTYKDLCGSRETKDGRRMIESFRHYLKIEGISMNDTELMDRYTDHLINTTENNKATTIHEKLLIAESLLETMTPGHIASSTAEAVYIERYGDAGAPSTRKTKLSKIRAFQNFLNGGEKA